MKRVAVVGSSGGHLFTLGGKDPSALLGEIVKQVAAAGGSVTKIAFVAASASLDQASDATPAALWVESDGDFTKGFEGSLGEVNQKTVDKGKEIAGGIEAGEIDALILVSADPKKTNRVVIEAAAKAGIPVVGTGGSAMSDTQSMRANVISMSGTTGTTNRTRAVGYAAALSGHWKTKYSPVIGKVTEGAAGSVWSRISLRGIMVASLPGFIAMALTLAAGQIPFLSESVGPLFGVLVGALPIIVAVIAARQVSGLDEVGIVAGVVAGVLSVDGGILGGIVGGVIAGILAPQLLTFSFKRRFPATTASIVAGCFSGLVGGLLVYFLLAPVALGLGNGIRGLIEAALEFNAVLAGAIAGLLIWPAIIGGVYHAAILPIVLLEMETQGFSFLGAIDMCGLVMVSAGITLGNIIAPKRKGDAAVALPGFLVNMFFGTFVEAAYPFMFSDKLIFATALIGATVSGAFCGFFNARGMGYLPTFVAPGLSNNPLGFAISMVVATAVSCVLTIIVNKASKTREG
ncbi:MAG: PTS sugar transporter [Chloroflexota bacterium]